MSLDKTIRKKSWLKDNKEKLAMLFPETWTHHRNLNMLHIAMSLKILGVDHKTEEDMAECFAAFEKNNIISRDVVLIKRA